MTNYLNQLCDKVPSKREASRLVGLNSHDLKYAKQRPFNHDWTLSQIERLADSLGLDPKQLLAEAALAK